MLTGRAADSVVVHAHGHQDHVGVRDVLTVVDVCRVEPRDAPKTVTVGESVPLRFRLTDPRTGEPELGLADVQVRAYRTDNWHRQAWAREVGDGTYEVSFVLPSAGVYWVVVECLSKRLQFHASPPVVLRAVAAARETDGGQER